MPPRYGQGAMRYYTQEAASIARERAHLTPLELAIEAVDMELISAWPGGTWRADLETASNLLRDLRGQEFTSVEHESVQRALWRDLEG